MGFAESETHRLQQQHPLTIVGGDFNWRLGHNFSRDTQDTKLHRAEEGCEWHNRTGLTPLYGREGQPPETCTSRIKTASGYGYAAPDGISTKADIPRGWKVEAIQPPPWDNFSSTGGCHRPIGATIKAPKLEKVTPPSELSQAAMMQPQHYGHKAYVDMHQPLLQGLQQAATDAQSNTLGIGSIIEHLGRSIVEIQHQHQKPAPQQRTRSNPASRIINYRKRQPTKALRALGDIYKLPPALEKSCKKQRGLYADIAAMNRKLRASGPVEHTELKTLIENKEKERRTLQFHIRKKMRSIEYKKAEKEARMLEKLAKRNPHKFHEYINHMLPTTYELHDNSSSIAHKNLPKFTQFFQTQLGSPDTPATGADDPEFDPYIARASHLASTAALVRPFTWEEAHLARYPAHHEVKAPMCHDQCLLCSKYNEQLASWRRGDSNMAAPEYRPRLWTSRSAGPDGILAETLRWCGPAEPEERLNYRQHVCEALTAVFNTILESGEVPPCPQFSKSRMSALYKGKGSREDPDKYRPICVGSSLGKIFGLILTARISHWVNTNSLISPAQIGFTPYMGCEHHIFTVLEILRDRARRRLDSCVVFVDFKKAYDNVDQNMAWTLLQKMGMPDQLVSLLRSWAETTEITLEMQGHKGASFRQLRGFLQGANLSPVLFTLVMEPLLRYVNSRSTELGVKIEDSPQPKQGRSSLPTTPDVPPPEIIHPPGRPPPLTPTWILALAYADDVILICPSRHQAQEAAQMVAKWAGKFGFTIGLGEGKTEAMFIWSQNVWEATKSSHRGATNPTETGDPTSAAPSDNEREHEPQPLLKGQKRVNGKIVGSHTPRAAPFAPSPLPHLPDLEPIYLDDDKSPDKQIKWTLTYKYLGFIIRCDLSDDHAFQRAETKMRIATNRLFPRHRLIRRFPLSLKLQLFHSLVTSCAIQALPQMSSLSTPSDPRVKRLDALVQKSVREIIRLSHSTVRSYIAAEALGVDAMSLLTMHRLRFKESLKLHPYCDQLPEQQPYAIRVMDRMVRVADTIAIRPGRATEATVTAWVPTELRPWMMSTNKIIQPLLQRADQLAIPRPTIAWRVAPYASTIARIAAQETWTRSSMKNIEHANHCFAVRPPSNSPRHVAAIHFSTRKPSLCDRTLA